MIFRSWYPWHWACHLELFLCQSRSLIIMLIMTFNARKKTCCWGVKNISCSNDSAHGSLKHILPKVGHLKTIIIWFPTAGGGWDRPAQLFAQWKSSLASETLLWLITICAFVHLPDLRAEVTMWIFCFILTYFIDIERHMRQKKEGKASCILAESWSCPPCVVVMLFLGRIHWH